MSNIPPPPQKKAGAREGGGSGEGITIRPQWWGPRLNSWLEFYYLCWEIKVIQAIETLTLFHRICLPIKFLENQKSQNKIFSLKGASNSYICGQKLCQPTPNYLARV